MKIGILTFHRANNFGAVLQCYALQRFLESLGAEVDVIDYRQKYIESVYNTINLDAVLSKLSHPKGLFTYLACLPKRQSRNKKFHGFIGTYLHMSKRTTSNKILGYDVIIHGSDQIWNPKLTGGEYDDVYMGNYIVSPHCRKIGYAISFENKAIDSNCVNYVRNSIKNFYSLAVREDGLRNHLSPITSKPIDTVVDPTLLLSGADYEKMIIPPCVTAPYVLVYTVGPSEAALNVANVIAQKRQLKVIDISHANISPNEFLGYIKNATFVVAVSFHGTVFSILFHKNFYTVLTGQPSDVRYKELLTITGLQDRLINEIPQFISNVDFSFFEEKRESYVSHSKAYLDVVVKNKV